MDKIMETIITFEQLGKELNMDDNFKIVKIYQKKGDAENTIRIVVEKLSEMEISQFQKKEPDLSFLDDFNLRQLETLKKAIELREELRKIDTRKLNYMTISKK